jgi:hypothetical protein
LSIVRLSVRWLPISDSPITAACAVAISPSKLPGSYFMK